jgi:hypothetical protein
MTERQVGPRSGRFVPRLLPFFLLAVAVAIPSRGSAQTPASRQLTLIHPDDPEFESLLNANFPGIELIEGYAIFRPYLILLRNDSAQEVRAYTIEWQSAKSETGFVRRTEAHFVEKYNPALPSDRGAFAQGELRLISPLFDVSAAEYPAKKSWVELSISTGSTHAPYASTDIKSVTASVDAAIFSDGIIAGADSHKLLLRYQCRREAERDVAAALLKLLDAKASETEVVNFLEGESQAGQQANTSQASHDTVYALFRGQEAQHFLTLYHRGGIEAVMERAWKIGQRRAEKISRQTPQ